MACHIRYENLVNDNDTFDVGNWIMPMAEKFRQWCKDNQIRNYTREDVRRFSEIYDYPKKAIK